MSKNCKNCFTPIEDLRKEVRCSICNEPLHKTCAIKDGGTFFCDVCYTVKEENKGKELIEVPKIIRRSYIELYKACPYKFLMEVIKGYEAPPSSFAKIGIDLHELFQQACLGKITTSEEMIKTYELIWNKYEDSLFEQDTFLYKDIDVKRLKIKLWNKAIDAIDTFYTILPALPSKALALEEKIIFSVGKDLPKVSITMDRIDKLEKGLIISDWKTGVVMVGKKLSSDLQAPLYIYAVREHYNIPVKKFNFYYLPENKIRTFNQVTNEDYECMVGKKKYCINLNDAIREVQSIFGKIKKNQFNIPHNTKPLYFTCKTCHLKHSNICKGAEIESWRQYN